MTKHRGGSSLLALAPPPPVITGLSSAGARAQRDHHLDSRSSNASLSIQRFSSDQTWHCSTNPLPEFGAWLDKLAISQDHRTSMDKVMRQESCYTAKPADHTGAQSSWDQDAISSGGKKKNYQRYPKPPYSYLAMIAMVIQNSPEKKLTLSEILKEISALFPFFKGNYKGWRDSVRHNLSSYDCFVKVLKDPGKPQGKGNFWTVEVSRVPVELLKRQNTAVSRQDETIFAQDLTPYIFQGYSQTNKSKTLPTDISSPPVSSPSPAEGPYRPKLDSTFAIDSLLHTLRPASSAGEGIRERESWRVEPPSHTHSTPPPRLCNTSYSCVSSSSSASPESDLSDEDWRGVTHVGKRLSDREFMSDRYNDSCPPPNKSAKHGSTPPWELPTSYAKYTPPNAVAPPSMRFNGNPFMPLGSIPFYSYGGTHVTTNHLITTVGHAYWPILQSGPVSIQAPPLLMDLDSMLQSVPPNKSVFDVLGPTSQTPHLSPNQYALQNGPSLCKFSL